MILSSLYSRQIRRIETELERYLPQEEARNVAVRIYSVARNIDRELRAILQDPNLGCFYEYDGLFFRPKKARGFHRAFSGVHLLESLSNISIHAYFHCRSRREAVACLMADLDQHRLAMKRRRISWQASRNLSSVSREVLDQIVKAIAHRQETEQCRKLPPEQERFFKSYELQMEEWQKNNGEAA